MSKMDKIKFLSDMTIDGDLVITGAKSGQVLLSSDPTKDMHAVTKRFFTNQLGDLEEGLNKIIEIQEGLLGGVIIPPEGGNPPEGDDTPDDGGDTPELPDEDEGISQYLEFTKLSEESNTYAVSAKQDSTLVEIQIPEQYKSGTVVSIAAEGFKDQKQLVSIVIPETITNIGEQAFLNCSSLKYIQIPNSVQTIERAAFRGCSAMEEIRLPFVGRSSQEYQSANTVLGYVFGGSYEGGVETVQKYSSSGGVRYYLPSSLKYVTITGGQVHYGAFSNCKNLKNIKLLEGVTLIGERIFGGCSSLVEVTVPFIGSSLGEPDMYHKKTQLFGYMFGTEEYDGAVKTTQWITSMGSYISYIPTTLTHVTVLQGDLYESAFSYCTRIQSIELKGNINTIGHGAFLYCSGLSEITLPEGLTNISQSAFNSCKNLTTITIPSTVTDIDSSAFADCVKLQSIQLPNNLIRIDKSVFNGCDQLQYMEYDESRFLGNNDNPYLVLMYGPLDKTRPSYVLPTTTKIICSNAFEDCMLESMVLPDSVTHIGSEVFQGCKKLRTITFGTNFVNMGQDCFRYCFRLAEGINKSTSYIRPAMLNYAILVHNNPTSLIVNQDGYYFIKENDDRIYLFDCDENNGSDLVLPTDYNGKQYRIKEFAFRDYNWIRSIKISAGVKDIGRGAFWDCGSLEEITVDSNSTIYTAIDGSLYSKDEKTLVQYALGKSDSIFVVPEKVEAIGAYALCGSLNLSHLVIGNNVITIDDYAIADCLQLMKVTFGMRVKTINEFAFAYCIQLNTITLPDSIQTIQNYAFLYCNALVEIQVPWNEGAVTGAPWGASNASIIYNSEV